MAPVVLFVTVSCWTNIPVRRSRTTPPRVTERPRTNFDPPTYFGALQLAVRLQQIAVSYAAFTQGLTSANASRKADVVTLGLNW